MIYPIVAYGDPILKQKAAVIEPGSIDIGALASDMFETMYHAHGVGLAAPQIGKSIRLFVVDAEPMDPENLKGFKRIFVNPIVVNENGDLWGYEEGCLSIPGIREKVNRESSITLRFQDEHFNEYEETFSGMAARIIQHEYDHLEGKLFIDYLTPLKRRLLKNKLIAISKGIADVEYPMKFIHR